MLLLKRIIILVISLLIMLSVIPIQSFALDEIGVDSVTSVNKDSVVYKDITEPNKFSTRVLAKAPSKVDIKFNAILDITEEDSPVDIENALIKSGFVNAMPTNSYEITNSYDSVALGKTKVALTTGIYEKVDGGGNNPNAGVDPVASLGSYRPDGFGTSITGSIFLKTGKSSEDTQLILRYYIYTGFNGPNNSSVVYVQDYDLTPIIDTINKDTTTSTSNTPVLNYIRNLQAKNAEDTLTLKKETQKSIWNSYRNGKSLVSFVQKPYIVKINEYILETASIAVPDKPNDLTASDNITLAIYSNAIFTSAIYNKDISTITSGTSITDSSESLESDWKNNKHKLVDLITTVPLANALAEKYNTTAPKYSELGIESNAGLFSDIVKYRYGKISGVEERGIGDASSDKRIINDRLEALLVTTDSLKAQVINPKLYDQYSNLTMYSYSVPLKEYADVMASLQLLESYSDAKNTKTTSGLSIVEGKVVNEALEKYLLDNDGKVVADKEVIKDGSLIRQVSTYKQIVDGMSFLNVKPWTDELVYITEKHGDINELNLSEDFDTYDDSSLTEPLKRFFSFNSESKVLSTNYLTGVSLSATYIPMQTNVYDPLSIRVLKNEDWLKDFHMKYGFYRKALMIDTNVNAAVDNYVTGSKDSSRVATLKDLLEYKKDIVLYVDDNFYNSDKAKEMVDKVYQRLSNTEQAGMDPEKFDGWFDNLFNDDMESILKTEAKNIYDESIIKNVSPYGKEEPIIDWSSIKESLFTDGLIFSSGKGPKDTDNNDIKKGLDQSEYSIKQPYAVVSGIYRHVDLANFLNSVATKPKPVFISSPALFNISNVPQFEFNSIYNYYMLRNLEDSIGVDYKTTLDINNPIYIDIYGNILTESGLVIIPAASNATLYPNNTYSPYTLGFMDLYSNGDNIPFSDKWSTDSPYLKNLVDFQPDENKKHLLQKNYEFNNIAVNPQTPSLSEKGLLSVLYDNQVSMLNSQSYDFKQRAHLITEVLRGAPLEEIDKTKEGLIGRQDVTKYGLYMSWKLDEISDMLLPTTNGNSILSMPNLAFMDGIEYIVLFSFKAILVLFVMYMMYRIYIDAVGGKLGLKTMLDCILTILTFTICLYLIPTVISLSYNEPNKIFLQDEIKYINLLNYEKSLEGREISAVGVNEPKSQTKLLLKLDTIKVPWYKLLDKVMFEPVGEGLELLYEEELEKNMLYGYENIQVVNDGVYIDVSDIFASSSVMYNNSQKFLFQNINTAPAASYFINYYYILDNLLLNISKYNTENDLTNITTKVQSDGSVKTMGMIGDYLLSEYFLVESNDPLGLFDLYGIDTNETSSFILDDEEMLDTTKNSMWYVKGAYSSEDIASRIDQLYSYMRSYVAQNRKMIGRVTDDTFVKTMMLDISMEYNKIFRIPAAKGVEVFSIDSRDLIRLSITDKNTAIVNSTNSFGKFVYEVTGGFGVILTAILLGIYFITSIVKPALVIFLCILLIYNLIIKKMFNGEKGKTVEGLIYTLAILVVVNSVYAVLLKLSMSLPTLGLNPTISILGQIAIQVFYLVFVYTIVGMIFKDISNFGYNVFQAGFTGISNFVTGSTSSITNKAMYTEEQQQYMESAKLKNESIDGITLDGLRAEMAARDKQRDLAQEEDVYMERIFNKDEDKK